MTEKLKRKCEKSPVKNAEQCVFLVPQAFTPFCSALSPGRVEQWVRYKPNKLMRRYKLLVNKIGKTVLSGYTVASLLFLVASVFEQ